MLPSGGARVIDSLQKRYVSRDRSNRVSSIYEGFKSNLTSLFRYCSIERAFTMFPCSPNFLTFPLFDDRNASNRSLYEYFTNENCGIFPISYRRIKNTIFKIKIKTLFFKHKIRKLIKLISPVIFKCNGS